MHLVREITLKGFLQEYKQIKEDDASRRFCFILGAGASVSSDIPGAAALAKTWLSEMYERSTDAEKMSSDEWFKRCKHGIKNFDDNDHAAMYFEIYKARFSQNPQDGCRRLEQLMEKGKPSYGYYVLAYILAKTNDNLVVTVNFDNLIADALYFYGRSHPIICGHDRVAPLMPTAPHRPMVIKVHHDIYLDPLSDPDAMQKLGEGFQAKLPEFLKSYTPIVIGYGGNDGSLMKGLLDCDRIAGGVYWCMRGDEKPPNSVINLLAKHRGSIVRIPSFDGFMAQLGAQVGFKLDEEALVESYRSDLKKVLEERDKLAQESIQPEAKTESATDDATLEALEKSSPEEGDKKPWWYYERVAKSAKTIKDKEAVYRQGLKDLPDSADLLENYGIFLKKFKKDHEKAEDCYMKAIAMNPANPRFYANYALFLKNVRDDPAAAAENYRKAIELDSAYGTALGGYANLLFSDLRELDEAEKYYKRAIDLDPTHPGRIGNYAGLLFARGREDAITYAVKAEDLIDYDRPLMVELRFYRYANGDPADREAQLATLYEKLTMGIRSPGWNLQPNIDRAIEQNHPEAAWLTKLAAVINSDAPIDSLDPWPAWQQARKELEA